MNKFVIILVLVFLVYFSFTKVYSQETIKSKDSIHIFSIHIVDNKYSYVINYGDFKIGRISIFSRNESLVVDTTFILRNSSSFKRLFKFCKRNHRYYRDCFPPRFGAEEFPKNDNEMLFTIILKLKNKKSDFIFSDDEPNFHFFMRNWMSDLFYLRLKDKVSRIKVEIEKGFFIKSKISNK